MNIIIAQIYSTVLATMFISFVILSLMQNSDLKVSKCVILENQKLVKIPILDLKLISYLSYLLSYKMYGLILCNFTSYLQHKYGEDAWDNIRRLTNIDTPTFSVHKVINYKSEVVDYKLRINVLFLVVSRAIVGSCC